MLQLFAVLKRSGARGRAGLPALGVARGVALGYGVHLVNRAAVGGLAASVRELAGEADLEVRADRSGFAESLYPQVARLAGVALAAPRLELDAGIAGTERTIRVIGLDVLREGGLHPQLELRPELLEPHRVFLSPQASRLVAGKTLRLTVGQKTVELEAAGVVPVKGVVAVTDIATAQWRLERLRQPHPLDPRLAPAADAAEGRERIAALLPPRVLVSTISEK